ncbi:MULTISPECIES: DUF1643 domain-containing protein [Gemmobacter]|uniref:DUF1643 domain-containing protein n=2 Tax=Gemmobacter TaxID=204456 RepID=A0A2T6AUW8_9RHOB|nr:MULTISPECIES: DUF1643 domain-containing protein [Gemmobacter]PTX47597.1 hypothetical protein C8N34_11286 [Gemmobacter caeni]TWI97788.1 hypothetical protein IQ03_02907 [Gemmobacter caeni]GHC28730.1 hypothetical protein GCM10007291_31330 [Gemmobacter nanjingensis]
MLLIRRHAEAGVQSRAAYSRCGLYRYYLSRRWGAGRLMLFVMLNPSTATERKNDQTLARCEKRARMGGAGGFAVVNLFALRSKEPADLKRADDPVGPLNDRLLRWAARVSGSAVCGWGNHGGLMGRDAAVLALLRASGAEVAHLGLTFAGQPRHPLYVPLAQTVQAWEITPPAEPA